MLTHPTQRLVALGLTGMAKALEEQRRQPDVAALAFEERLGLLVDREAIERENKRLVSRLKFAGLQAEAAVEDVDIKAARGLDKALFAKLVAGDWIDQPPEPDHHRPDRRSAKAGSPARSATRHAATTARCSTIACRRLFDALALARGDGRHAAALEDPRARRAADPRRLGARATLTAEQGRDLLEILDDRHGRGIDDHDQPGRRRSTGTTMIANPTVADAILDRLVHNAHRLNLDGDSMRKAAAKRAPLDGKPSA